MINLGIVGLGPVWEQRYRPVLDKLKHRIRIGAVYDAVARRCEQVAFEMGAVPYEGIAALLSRTDLRGILVLDTSWHGNVLLHFLRKSRKPAYVAGSLGENWDELLRLRSLVDSEGLLLMPEFSRRFTPATCRLHELIATRLGRPRQISIAAVAPSLDAPGVVPGQSAGTDFLVGLLDWCRYVVRSATVRLEVRISSEETSIADGQQTIAIEFAESRDPERRPTAELRLFPPVPPSDGGQSAVTPPSFTVICEHGQAVIDSAERIQWSTVDGATMSESLTADRSEVEVMIDHFCRRIVGGLVPVADISDVCHCLHLVQAASTSLATRGPVDVSRHFA